MRPTSTFILFIFLLFTGLLKAQDTITPRLKLGVSASADYCSYLLYIDGVQQERGSMFFNEMPAAGWSAGVISDFAWMPLVSVTGGIRFTEHNIVNGPQNMYDINMNKVGTYKLTYHTRYIDAPLGLQFTSNTEKRFSFIANATIAPGYAMGEWTRLEFVGEDSLGISNHTSHTNPARFNYFSLKAEAYVGLGINTDRCQMQILPQVRTSVTKATSDSYINRRYFTIGLEFRLFYTL